MIMNNSTFKIWHFIHRVLANKHTHTQRVRERERKRQDFFFFLDQSKKLPNHNGKFCQK